MEKVKKYKDIKLMMYILLKYIPIYSVFMLILTLLPTSLSILQIQVISDFIDAAVSSVQSGYTIPKLYFEICLLSCIVGVTWICSNLLKIVSIRAKLILKKHMSGNIVEKCAKMEFYNIEDTEVWNLISRVSDETEIKILDGYSSVLSILSIILSITGVLAYIIVQVWWAAILILIFCFPLFYISIKSGKGNYQANREASEYLRKSNYLSEVLDGRDSIDERTIFEYSDKINDKYTQAYNKFYKKRVSVSVKWMVKTKIGGAISAMASILVMIILLKPVLSGVISVGMFISIINAILSLSNQLSWQLSTQIDKAIFTKELMNDLHKFFNESEVTNVLDVPSKSFEINSIEFKNVFFKYPNTDNLILKNVSLKLEKGKHYSFVGSNGAGKTTIIKLLTGLYKNYSGEILVNGIELRKYSESEIKSMFSVIYQDFSRYSLSIKDNILIGNIKEFSSEDSNKKVIKCLEDVGLAMDEINSLPEGIDTKLGKIYGDGIDLSGGQWQRIALARAMVNKGGIRILDEPTAAMDPLVESDIYDLFHKRNRNILTIFISHRLGITRLVDKIIVFDNGQVVEQGTYDELMNSRGMYYNMFEKQRKWYK